MPVHVTLRVAEHVWNLRSRRSFRVFERALYAGADRFGSRVVQFSVQGNHLHLLVEAGDTQALCQGVKALSIRVAKGMNRLMGTQGRVMGDRYHARVLRTPTEVRACVHYIRQNYRKHSAERGSRLAVGWIDPYSSDARTVTLPTPQTWLVRQAGLEPRGPDAASEPS